MTQVYQSCNLPEHCSVIKTCVFYVVINLFSLSFFNQGKAGKKIGTS